MVIGFFSSVKLCIGNPDTGLVTMWKEIEFFTALLYCHVCFNGFSLAYASKQGGHGRVLPLPPDISRWVGGSERSICPPPHTFCVTN